MRMDALHGEGDHAAFICARPVHGQSRDTTHLFHRVGGDLVLVSRDCIHTNTTQVINSCAKSYRFGNRGGACFKLVRQVIGVKAFKVTFLIISPPPRKGGMVSSKACLPYSAPIPVGPHILCAENARKSTSRSRTFTWKCGTDWAPSSMSTAPASCAMRIISFAGVIVPSILDICVKATRLGQGRADAVCLHIEQEILVMGYTGCAGLSQQPGYAREPCWSGVPFPSAGRDPRLSKIFYPRKSHQVDRLGRIPRINDFFRSSRINAAIRWRALS